MKLHLALSIGFWSISSKAAFGKIRSYSSHVFMRSDQRKLSISCPDDLVHNSCSNCCGKSFADKAALSTAISDYPTNKVTFGEMKCWDVSSLTDMSQLFENSASNEPIECWDVSSVTNMNSMFGFALSFNQPIGIWNVSKVTTMGGMFDNAQSFDQPLGSWDVSRVTAMYSMFWSAVKFNQDLSNWNVSSVIDMNNMFTQATNFDQHIGQWNVRSVQGMSYMFDGASSFNQDICPWYNVLHSGVGVTLMLRDSGCLMKENPNFESMGAFCQACQCSGGAGSCTACNKACDTSAECYGSCNVCKGGTCNHPDVPTTSEWVVSLNDIFLKDLVYTSSGVSFTLNFNSGKHSTALQLFSQDCITSISPETPPVFTYSSPIMQDIDMNTQSVSYAISGNLSSLKESNIYEASKSTNKTTVASFCARLDLLDESNKSVSFIKSPVELTLNLTKSLNFSINDASVSETLQGNLTRDSVAVDAMISACVCDSSTFNCYDPVPSHGPFSILSVCVYTLNATTVIDQVSSFRVTQSGTSATLESIVNGVTSTLTTFTQSNDKKKVCISTQLYSDFFDDVTAANKDQRKLSAHGSVQIRLSNGARRLMGFPEAIIGSGLVRSLKLRESSQESSDSKPSVFQVDQIGVSEREGSPGTQILGGLGLVIGLVLIVLASIVGVSVVLVQKRSANRKKYSLSRA